MTARRALVLLAALLAPGLLHAQQDAPPSADSVRATLYLKEGATIRGTILADNGPNGIRIRSLKSGATFLVPVAQIDSVVREPLAPAARPAAPLVVAVAPPPPAPVEAPVVMPATTQAQTPVMMPTPTAERAPAPAPAAEPRRDSIQTISIAATPPLLQAGLEPRPAPAAAAASVDTTPPAVPQKPDTTPKLATITFISGPEIYVGAGRLDGLKEGSTLEVIRGGASVATLRVKYLASHRSNTEAVGSSPQLALGDTVRYRAAQPAPTEIAAAMPVGLPRRTSGQGLHGRVGTRYLHANTTTVASGQPLGSNGFNQPSLDLRLFGQAIGGSALGMAVDIRARQTTSTAAGVTTVDGRTKAYQAVLYWNAPGAPFRAAAGRQYLSAVGSIGLLDGALLEVNRSALTAGAFFGWEPDPATLGFSGAVHDYGLYFTAHNRPGQMTAAAFTLGAVGSYEGSVERREWGIIQANVSSRKLSLFLLQEIDYYRPWKLEGPNAEASAISWTSQFANATFRPQTWLSLTATYDKRRSVPTIRDFTNPETVFDDTYREGYGMGAQYAGRRFYVGGDWRRSTGGAALGADAYTFTFGGMRLLPMGLGLSARATWYHNDNDSTGINPAALRTVGQLYSAHLSADPITAVHLDINGGLRQEDNPEFAAAQRSTWFGADLDWAAARQWYLSVSALVQHDPANPGTSTLTQFYGGVTWRF